MNDDLELADRLRLALHDLDARTHTLVSDRSPTPIGPGPRRGRSRPLLVPGLAGLAVTALLITVVGLTRSDPAGVAPTGSSDRPSQSFREAVRDHVNPKIADLPLSVRLDPVAPQHPGIPTQVSTSEGVWVISSPDLSSITGHCPNPPPTFYPLEGPDGRPGPAVSGGTSLQHRTCVEYTEILQMSPDLSRVLRAYPMANNPPQWLSLTSDAIYCGRQDGIVSMVCRIDLATDALIGRTFPAKKPVSPKELPNSILSQEFPGIWTTQKPSTLTGFDQAEISAGALQISDYHGTPTVRLDPRTLVPVPPT